MAVLGLLYVFMLYIDRVFSCCSGGGYSNCGMQSSHSGGFPWCRPWALGVRASVVAPSGLQSTGSVLVAHGLSFPIARGIFQN